MAVQRHEIVAGEDSEIHDEPHLAGRRLTVRTLAAAVEERGLDPHAVAERYDVPVADVYRALTYYHDHPEEMAAVERHRREAERRARGRGVPTVDELADRVDGDAEE
jgi:uncharacterized protein (DUF433 family)